MVKVALTVRNAGARTGWAVPEIYLAMPAGFALLAVHLLIMARGFVRSREVLGDGEFDADTARL